MSFMDDAEKANESGYRARGCGVGVTLARLDPVTSQEVREVLENRPEIASTAIRKALAQRWHAGDPWRIPSAYTIQRHRRGVCGCEPTPGSNP